MYFGQEGERLEQKRAEQRSQYAAELKRQIEEQGKPSVLRQNAHNVISQQYRVTDDEPQRQVTNYATKTFNDDDIRAQSPRRHQNDRYNDNDSPSPSPTSYQPNINQISQNIIDRILNYELPMRLKPLEDAVSNVNTKLNRSNANANDLFSTIRDKISDLTMNYTNLSQKTEENALKIKYINSELSEKGQKYQESLKANQNAPNMSGIEEDVIALTKWKTNMEQSLNSSIEQINRMISDLSQNSYKSDQHIMQQIEGMNNQNAFTFGKVSTCINSIQDTISEIQKNINIINNNCSVSIDKINKKVDSFAENCANSNHAFQNEISQTISSMHDYINKQVASLEEALCGEVNARKNNTIPESAKIGDFNISDIKEVINNEFKGYFETIMQRIDEYENHVKENSHETNQRMTKINEHLCSRMEFIEERLITNNDGRPKTSDTGRRTLSNSSNFARPVIRLSNIIVKNPQTRESIEDLKLKLYDPPKAILSPKSANVPYKIEMDGISVRDSVNNFLNDEPRPDTPVHVSPKNQDKKKRKPKVSFILPDWFVPPPQRDASYYMTPIDEEIAYYDEPPYDYSQMQQDEEEDNDNEQNEEDKNDDENAQNNEDKAEEKEKSPVKPPDVPNDGKKRRPVSPKKNKKDSFSRSVNAQFMIAQKITPINISDFDGNSSLGPIEMIQFTQKPKD